MDIDKIFSKAPTSFFHFLSKQEKEYFLNRMEMRTYKKGDYICRTGETPAGLFCMMSGKAKIFRVGPGGREHIFRLVKPTELIGYAALFAEQVYGASASAIEDSSAAFIERETFFKALHNRNELYLAILKSLATELGFLYFRTMTLTQKQMPGRLSETLLFLRDNYGFESDGVTLKVRISREEIANMSNMSTSNAIRTLSSFARKKLIGVEGKNIQLLDIEHLEEISKEDRRKPARKNT